MAIQLTGRKIESEDEVFIRRNDDEVYAFPRKISSFQTRAKISPNEYTLIQQGAYPDYQSDLAISMKQEFNSLKHANAIAEALKRGLNVPTPLIFLPHYMHANEALENKAVLYDASGSLIEGKELRRYVNRLNWDCWAHLNAGFPEEKEKGTGFLGLDLAVMTGLDPEGYPIFSTSPLEDCLEENCYADLESLNSQGLPTKKAKESWYTPGKVIYFLRPYKDRVTAFSANSDGASLNCGRIYSDSYSTIKIFLCVEGTQN